MSYDLMVFRNESAPKNRGEFMNWYQNQTEWTEEHSYDDPAITTIELRNWFMEMIQTFPALNGPFANEDVDGDYVSDYSIGRDVIYVGFAWSLVEEAFRTVVELAEKYSVGFFDVSSENGDIYFPENGKLIPIPNPDKLIIEEKAIKRGKPWWKLWQREPG